MIEKPIPLSDLEFSKLRQLMLEKTGIAFKDSKRSLLVSRLMSRLRKRGVGSFLEYCGLITRPEEGDELQAAIDLVTTNETSFFREPDHFRVLREHIEAQRPVPSPFRVWSAASSSGEEAYTIAMVLAEVMGGAEWEILGTDISTRVLDRARRAIYPMERSSTIPKVMLHRHCLKGRGSHEGMFMVSRRLYERVQFRQMNLCRPLPELKPFDVIFLRNVLIYFELERKRQIVESLCTKLKPEGILIVGHSESLNGVTQCVSPIHPSIYRRMS